MKKAGAILSFKRMTSLCALPLALSVALAGPAAFADDDQFQIESSRWMSLDHYRDSETGNPSISNASVKVPALAPSVAPQPAASAEPAATATINTPSRSFASPTMPGLSKGFAMQVTTTADQSAAASPPDVGAENAPKLSDQNWQKPSAALHYKSSADPLDENGDIKPIDVRMTYLPNPDTTPLPSPEHQSAQHLARLALEKNLSTHSSTHAPAVSNAVACAAIDAYKKEQLDAIQRDRQTLKALQQAIASLGLQKQLDFMPGSDGSLNASADASSNANGATTVR